MTAIETNLGDVIGVLPAGDGCVSTKHVLTDFTKEVPHSTRKTRVGAAVKSEVDAYRIAHSA